MKQSDIRRANRFHFFYVNSNSLFPMQEYQIIGEAGDSSSLRWAPPGDFEEEESPQHPQHPTLEDVKLMVHHILRDAVQQIKTLPEQRCAIAVRGDEDGEFLKGLWQGHAFDLKGIYIPSIDQMPAGILNCFPACGKNFHVNAWDLEDVEGGTRESFPWVHWYLSKPGKSLPRNSTRKQMDTRFGCIQCPLTQVQ